MWLLNHAGLLNLACSLLVLISGAIVYRFTKPRVFEEHPYVKRAFVFWLLLWFVLILTWAVYTGKPSRLVLAFVDLYTISAFGFYWAYSEAADFQWFRTAQNLVFLYAGLLLWNVLVGGHALQDAPQSYWRWVWILPSEAVSALALILLALAFLFRYGPVAIPLSCVVIPLYALFQRPTYTIMFLEKSDPGWILTLASGKLIFGLVFYTLFFSPARNYVAIQIPHISPYDASAVRKWSRLAAGAFASAVLALLATKLTDWIAHLLKR